MVSKQVTALSAVVDIDASILSDEVVGNETAFTTELQPGSQLLNEDGDLIGAVLEITDDTHLTLEALAASDVDAGAFSTNGLVYLPYDAADFDPDGAVSKRPWQRCKDGIIV